MMRATHPSISPDGSQIAFSWQGDIWTSPIEGGGARRLTVHQALDNFPRWTPDGKSIVFTSTRYGSSDIFSITADGGNLKRLTFDGSSESGTMVSNDGKWIYGHTNAWGRSDIFRVSIDGGDLVRLTGHPMEIEYSPALAADGTTIFYVQGGSAGNWRNPYMAGSNTGEVMVGKLGTPISSAKKLTNDEFNDFNPMVAANGNVIFISNRSGWPNLWSMRPDGSGLKRLTNHVDGTMRWASINAGGNKVAYEFASQIFTFDVATAKSTLLSVDMPDDRPLNPILKATLTSGVSSASISPDGKKALIGLRGDIYLIPEKGGTTRRVVDSLALDSSPIFVDSQNFAFETMRTGKSEIWTSDLAGKVKPLFADAKDLHSGALSPDGKTWLMMRGDNEVVMAPASGGELKVVSTGPFQDSFQGTSYFAWSPDSKYFVVETPTQRASKVEIVEVATGKRILAAVPMRELSTQPQWLPNGKGIFFIGQDGEDQCLFVVDLVDQDVTFSEDDLDKIDSAAKKPEEGITVKIDTKGLLDRARIIARDASGAIAGPDGKTIYANVAGQFSAIPVNGGGINAVAGITGPAGGFLGTNKKLYLVQGSTFMGWNPAGPPAPIRFAAEIKVDRQAEEMELFKQMWWALSRMYYNPAMNGKDWDRIKATYSRLVPTTTSRDDFYALMAEMVEELDSSHLGATAPPSVPPGIDSEVAGWFGTEWDWNAMVKGEYVIGKVLDGTPADNSNSALMVGDKIVAINGTKLGGTTAASKLLVDTVGRKCSVELVRGGKTMTVEIKPTTAALRTALYYEDWIRWNRETVEKLSGGRLTYHHVQSMDEPSYQRFLRDIRTLTGDKQGVIFDVRFNGGGSTSHKILGVLSKKTWLYRTVRSAPDMLMSENFFRGDSLEMPSGLLTNQYSFSNAEILSEGFQTLKIGPVFGERTGGGVIGTGAYGLWDGGMIRMPAIGCYTVNMENLERNGRKPNFTVPFDANSWNMGRDPQIEKAVQEMLKRLPAKK